MKKEADGKVKIAFKSNFTQVPNAGLGKELTLAASGLYSRILRMAGIPNIPLTKQSIRNGCSEKNKAFEAVWSELKEKGYIVQYLQPKKSGRGWYQEYEILDVPRKDGIHTIYRNKEGVETGKTNLNRDRYPPEGIYGHGSNGNGTYGKGGNKRYNNISFNNIINNISESPQNFNNQFCSITQHRYDFDKLEHELLKSNYAEEE